MIDETNEVDEIRKDLFTALQAARKAFDEQADKDGWSDVFVLKLVGEIVSSHDYATPIYRVVDETPREPEKVQRGE